MKKRQTSIKSRVGYLQSNRFCSSLSRSRWNILPFSIYVWWFDLANLLIPTSRSTLDLHLIWYSHSSSPPWYSYSLMLHTSRLVKAFWLLAVAWWWCWHGTMLVIKHFEHLITINLFNILFLFQKSQMPKVCDENKKKNLHPSILLLRFPK